MRTMQERLASYGAEGGWHDVADVMVELAALLGVTGDDGYSTHKWVFESANPVGAALLDCLQALGEAGVLEFDDELDVRWNPAFSLR